jgi:hypothetical protein
LPFEADAEVAGGALRARGVRALPRLRQALE